MARRPRKPGIDTRLVDGTRWRLADEVQYIQSRAAEYDSRIVTIGPLVLFSTQTGDAFVYVDKDARRARTILGYPTQLIAEHSRL